MKTNLIGHSKPALISTLVFSSLLGLGSLRVVQAATTVTSNPKNGATGVSPSAAVVFTFSAAMDTTTTVAAFYSVNPPGSFPVTSSWNGAGTILTCMPASPFPANANISWAVFGQDATQMPVSAMGGFNTGAGSGGGGGSGTNATTTFLAGKLYLNQQLSAGAPTLDSFAPYDFTATTSLASNRTAVSITLMLPSGGVSNLVQVFSRPEDYNLFAYDTNNTRFESTFAEGDYLFTVTAASSNQQVTVTLPANMTQPNAPHISNFPQAQGVAPNKAFTLNWDPFQGGTATDYIGVSVGNNLFQTPSLGMNGALNGTMTSITIPPGTLPANSTNSAELIFYHFLATSNLTFSTGAYRATGTQFNITTTAGTAAPPPVVGNPVWSGGNFGFDVMTLSNQALKVRYATNCSLPIAQWEILLTTNSPGTNVHFVIPPQPDPIGFFRLQNGP